MVFTLVPFVFIEQLVDIQFQQNRFQNRDNSSHIPNIGYVQRTGLPPRQAVLASSGPNVLDVLAFLMASATSIDEKNYWETVCYFNKTTFRLNTL